MKTPDPDPLVSNAILAGVTVLVGLLTAFLIWQSAGNHTRRTYAERRFGPGWTCTGVPEEGEVCVRDPPPPGRR